jgi:hypothetical protein
MSDTQNDANVRSEEPELDDEALEQVAGGCQIDSHLHDQQMLTIIRPS